MSCNAPLIAKPDGYYPSGKVKYLPISRYDASMMKDYPDAIKIPCGKCAGCRAQKTREWADRMILELDHSKKAVFLTLTYNDDHLPVKFQVTTGQCEMTLQKRDLTLFFKRLRKRFPDKELRYYAAGEYGSKGRPHYHIILFGIDLLDFRDLVYRGTNELKQPYFSSSELAESVWKNGYCLLAGVSWNTCAYVARYIRKKNFGLVSDEFVDRMVEPEYSVMSRDPGIGMYYLQEHPECVVQTKMYFGDQNGVVEVHFPRAFLRQLEQIDPLKYEELKQQRNAAASDAELNKICQTDLSSMELDDMQEDKMQNSGKVIDFYRSL